MIETKAWHSIGSRLFSESIHIPYTDAYMCHYKKLLTNMDFKRIHVVWNHKLNFKSCAPFTNVYPPGTTCQQRIWLTRYFQTSAFTLNG